MVAFALLILAGCAEWMPAKIPPPALECRCHCETEGNDHGEETIEEYQESQEPASKAPAPNGIRPIQVQAVGAVARSGPPPELILWGSSSAAAGSALVNAIGTELRKTVLPLGQVGLTLPEAADSEQLAAVIRARRAHGAPARTLIYLGANDAAGFDRRTYYVREITFALRAAGIDPLWLPLPAYPAMAQRARADAQAISLRAAGVPCAGYGPVPLPDHWHRGDGVHFSASGAAAYARAVSGHLRDSHAMTAAAALVALWFAA